MSWLDCTYLPGSWCPEDDGVGDTGDDEHGEAHEEGSYDGVERAEERDQESKEPQQHAHRQPNQHPGPEGRLMDPPVLLPHEIEGHDVQPKCYRLCKSHIKSSMLG
jgi:hypothetical protein